MSTYFYLADDENKVQGGFFSRQAWGWGNADTIDNMRFLMWIADNSGKVRIFSEHEECDYRKITQEELAEYYPRDDCWGERPNSASKAWDAHKLIREKV